MGNSELHTALGLLEFLGFFVVFLLVLALMLIQLWNLSRDVRATPPRVLPPHVVRRSVLFVLTILVLFSLMNLFPEANRDRYTVLSFLANILAGAVIWGLIVAATIWWEMRRKTIDNQTHSDM